MNPAVAFFVGSAVTVGVAFLADRFVKPGVERLMADLGTARDKLFTYADNRMLQVADHLEEIALAQKHVDVKTADADRAKRIASKIQELLNG